MRIFLSVWGSRLSISLVEYQFECVVLLSMKYKMFNRSSRRIAVYEYARFECISFDFDVWSIRRLHESINRLFSCSSLFVHFERLHCITFLAASVIVVGWILVLTQKWALLTQCFFVSRNNRKIRYSTVNSRTQCIHAQAHIQFCGRKKSTNIATKLAAVDRASLSLAFALALSHSLRSRHSVVLCMCLSVRLFLSLSRSLSVCLLSMCVFILWLWCVVYWSSRECLSKYRLNETFNIALDTWRVREWERRRRRCRDSRLHSYWIV